MEEKIKDRLEAYLKAKKESKSEFGRKIGVSNSYISSMRKSIQPDKMEKIKKMYPDLNIEWLMTGEGDMIVGEISGGNNAIGREAVLNINESETINNLIAVIKKEQEQKDRMLAIIEDLTSKIK